MSTSDELIRKAVEACENLQVMIDISATTLHSLRVSLQSNPSSQASQALREAEAKLVKMFSRQLVSKASVAKIIDGPILDQYPNTEQWLKVVGLPPNTVKGLITENVNLDKLLKMTPERIADAMKRTGAQQSETTTLNKALGKLRAWTESQMSGLPMAVDKPSDLFWTEPILGSPHSQRSNRLAQIPSPSRHTSTGSISRSSTSSISSDQHSTLGSGPHHGSHTGTLASQYSSSSGQAGSALSSPHFRNPQSRSPVIQHPSTPTIFKGKSRPNTPPPQKRNVFIFPGSVQTNAGATLSSQSITKSMSHDSTLTCRAPIIDTLIQSNISVDDHSDVPSLHSSRSEYFNPRMTPKHRIEHRFDTKYIRFGPCDYCKRQLTLIARVCRHCRYKCHKDCEKNISRYSCGLTDDLVKEATKIFRENSRHNIQGSPSLSNGSLQGSFHRGSTSIQDSSSASDYSSSSPSSPLYSAYSAQASPANLEQFTFPFTPNRQPSSPQLSPIDLDNYHNRQLTVAEKDKLTSTVSTIDSQDTVIASRGTIEQNVDCRKSEGSDQTVIDSNSSEKTLPDQLEISFKGEDVHMPMYRQPSLSKALEEWIIPYDELTIEEELGTGHVGTVFKAQWHGPVAIKKIPINPAVDRNDQILAFKQEIATLKKTRHENVVLFMGACMNPLAIVTSFVNGDTLYKETRAMARWHLTKVTNIASQITQGMAYLHSKDIMHKHLTSKNVFVERGEKVVITDFGLQNVARLAWSHVSRSDLMKIPDGWLSYLSPEVIKALRVTNPSEFKVSLPFSKQSDIYAFGTIWYELLCGDWPHSSNVATELVIWQVGNGLKPSLHSMTNTTKESKDILMRCWMYSTQDRPSFSVLSNMLERLPKKRLTRSPSYPIQLSRSIDSFFKLLD